MSGVTGGSGVGPGSGPGGGGGVGGYAGGDWSEAGIFRCARAGGGF